MLITDSSALVTGAARGIGRETALAFARGGADVAVLDIDEAEGEATAEAVNRLGRRGVYLRCDVSDPASVSAAILRAERQLGGLDYACNNAGIEGEQAPTAEATLENFDRVLGVNLRGLFVCLREELAIMLDQGHGSIVNIASVAGLVGFAGLPAYCAAKGGVVQLTRTAAVEYAEWGIRVNAVCPGAVQTDMIDRITGRDASTVARFRELHPMKRFATCVEVAETVVWLCSAGAGFITGQALAVDGGLVAR